MSSKIVATNLSLMDKILVLQNIPWFIADTGSLSTYIIVCRHIVIFTCMTTNQNDKTTVCVLIIPHNTNVLSTIEFLNYHFELSLMQVLYITSG